MTQPTQTIPHPRVRTPTVLQMEAVECGAAALGIVLGYYGKFPPLEELRLACGVSRDGSKASNMLRAARAYGLTARGFRFDTQGVLEQQFPIIVFWNFNHFLVLEGVKGERVFLNDPAMGPRTVSRQEFDDAFTGVVLLLEPGPGFTPDGRRPRLVQRLASRLTRSKAALTYVVLASLFLIIPGILVPGFTKIFVDEYLIHGEHDWLRPLLLGMGITLLLRLALTWLQQTYLLRLETKLALTSSATFLWHVLRCPIEFFTQRYAGDLSQRVQSNDRIATLLSGDLGTSLVNLCAIAFYAAVMALYDWLLTALSVGLALVNVAALRYIQRQRTDTSMRLMQERGKLWATGMGGLQIIETLKATGSENDFFSRWAGYQTKAINSEQQLGLFNHTIAVLPAFLSGLSTAIILGVGGFRVISGVLSIGSLVAFQSLLESFNDPITKLLGVSGKVQEIHGDLARVDDVFNYALDARFTRNGAMRPYTGRARLSGRIELHDVTFGYSRLELPLIEHFTLHLEPGARVALVGGSGSGKSTIARLIAGLYRPWSGAILIDGIPLEEIPHEVLVTSLASVDQEIFLFGGSVRDNLTLWDGSIPEEALTQAAKDACIYDVIAARSGGFESPVEPGGVNFSGGQAQRLEIARSLVLQPSILILDEAMSALDPTTEALIDHNLRQRGCTCVIVAHRLSTIRDCDEIIVLELGKVVERGRHADMIPASGPYAALVTGE